MRLLDNSRMCLKATFLSTSCLTQCERCLKSYLSKHQLLTYIPFIQSVIDYRAPLFLKMSFLRRIQKRANRIICGPLCDDDCLPNVLCRWKRLLVGIFSKIVENDKHLLHHYLPKKKKYSVHYQIIF